MSRLLPLLTWLAFPAYVWQGVGVRLRTERMQPAAGPVLHQTDGSEPALSLLVLGDSSAASVGIGHAGDGLAAQLALLIGERTGRAVRWRAAGFSSATSAELRDHVVPNLAPEPWSHIVLAVGTNDVKNFHSVPRFKRSFGGLLYALRAKWPEARLVWCPAIDFTRVPALPPLLGQILEVRAGAINAMGERLCGERGAIAAARLPVLGASGFASDGFHGSELGYRAWAAHVVATVLDAGADSSRESGSPADGAGATQPTSAIARD
jgi:lysophospholipase L1-like esterase